MERREALDACEAPVGKPCDRPAARRAKARAHLAINALASRRSIAAFHSSGGTGDRSAARAVLRIAARAQAYEAKARRTAAPRSAAETSRDGALKSEQGKRN